MALAAAVVATLAFGTYGAICAGVLAVLAILFGILKRRKAQKGGIFPIVLAVLAIILTLVMNSFWSGMFTEMHEKAMKYKPDGLWAAATEDTKSGLVGILSQMPQDEAGVNALIDEMNELNQIEENQ